MGIRLEFIFHSLGLHSPLIGAIPVLMDKLSGLVVVHRLNLILGVLDVRTLYLEALNEHFLWEEMRGNLKATDQKEEEEELRIYVYISSSEFKHLCPFILLHRRVYIEEMRNCRYTWCNVIGDQAPPRRSSAMQKAKKTRPISPSF